jgi:hypothetical protein
MEQGFSLYKSTHASTLIQNSMLHAEIRETK